MDPLSGYGVLQGLYPSNKAFHDDVVSAFLQVANDVVALSRDKDAPATVVTVNSTAYSLLREAELFAVHPSQYVSACKAVDHALALRMLKDLDIGPEQYGFDPNDPRIAELVSSVAREIMVDSNLPFGAFFISFGTKVPRWSEEQCADFNRRLVAEERSPWRAGREERPKQMQLKRVDVLGYLVGRIDDVDHVFIALMMHRIAGGSFINVQPIYIAGEWDLASDTAAWDGTFDPWLVAMFIDLINSHKSVLVSRPVSAGNRFDRKRLSKKHRMLLPLPAAFYEVQLQDQVIDRTIRRMVVQRQVEWSHRWSVRGHYKVRIRKGNPADPNTSRVIASLVKRGYKVYRDAADIVPSSDDWHDINLRRVNLRHGEWVAILRSWVGDHVKGPADKPFVPALRTT